MRVITLVGEVDIATIDSLDEAVANEFDPGDGQRWPTVVIDLAGVSFMDSTGLRTLIATHESLRQDGRSLVLIVGTGPVSRLFEIAGVASTLDLRSSSDFLSPAS